MIKPNAIKIIDAIHVRSYINQTIKWGTCYVTVSPIVIFDLYKSGKIQLYDRPDSVHLFRAMMTDKSLFTKCEVLSTNGQKLTIALNSKYDNVLKTKRITIKYRNNISHVHKID